MDKITWKEVLWQLKNDAIGKDAFRGVTFTYTWLANQFGHFSFGFIIAFFLYKSFITFQIFNYILFPVETACEICIGIILVFEFANYRKSIYGSLFRKTKNTLFEQDWKNLLSDLITDFCFFFYGTLIFYLAFSPKFSWTFDVLIVSISLGLLFLLSRVWYIRKMYQYHAHFPFQLRLGQIKKITSKNSIKRILIYCKREGAGNHLLIFGSYKYENNGIAVAIGNEFAIKRKKVLYTTLANFLRMQHDNYEELIKYNGKRGLWTWREARYVIVDHIQAGDPVNCLWISPEEIFYEIMNDKFADQNVSAILKQNIIWVVGDIPNDVNRKKFKQEWVDMLKNLGVKKKPDQIDLTDTIEKIDYE